MSANHETGVSLKEITMTQLETRYIIKNRKAEARKECEVRLVYRGTAYKKTVTV